MAMKAEVLVARLLFLGGVVSVALMLAGLVDLEIRTATSSRSIDVARVVENRQVGRSVDVYVSLPQLARALRRRPPDPVAIITTGIVLLLLTPAIGLAAALVGFVREGDRTYAVISAVLILALLCGFAFRLGG
jgi:uncharacterized membrane protein